MTNKEYAFIIPAYNPDEMLLEVVNNIQKESNNKIFVINDGSNENSKYIFEQLKDSKNIYLIEHAINMGKGAALKTIFNHILVNFPNIVGAVTLDSDGQHSVLDSIRVLEELKSNNNAFVLGYRIFSKDIPLKSYVGNNISRFIYKLILSRSFKDTQTGLRGLSKDFMKKCLAIKSNRFEFETEQLALSTNQNNDVNIVEIAIETIYIENNKATSFRPLVDSFKIYFVLFRYGFSSILTAITDFIVFLTVFQLGGSIFLSNMLARTASISVQFTLLNKFVFHTKAKWKNFILFIIYVYIMGIFSILAQIQAVEVLNISEISSKLMIEAILFFINFAFLRLYIFSKKGR
jgi:hypothetical protein